MTPQDIKSIERATHAALPPDAVAELPGWLLGLDAGTVGRAHSAVPLRHDGAAVDPAGLDAVISRYTAQGLGAVFRIPRLPGFDAVRASLAARGWRATQPTCVQVAAVDDVSALAARAPTVAAVVTLSPQADERWASVYLGEGFDPVDGACRVRLLRKSVSSLYATASVDGQPVAVGTAGFGHGWASVHGMRTVPALRGRGLAGAILGLMAQEAAARGMGRMFLQVEEANTGAQSLYRRAGFATAWVYEYWRRDRRPG